MAGRGRKDRGMRTQLLVARYFAGRGWPFAESVGSGRAGSDVRGMPDVAVEVKARTDFSPLAWVRQARAARKPGQFPMVVFRCNGQGETTIGEWLVCVRLEDQVKLLQQAGYGDPERYEDWKDLPPEGEQIA